MRKADGEDRQITAASEIVEILKKCEVIRVGMFDDDFPYVVPVNHGVKIEDGKIFLYFHGARIGKKYELLKKDGRVCVEADIYSHMYEEPDYIDTVYESVIGYGHCRLIEDRHKKVEAMKILLASCGFPEHSVNDCLGLDRATVFEIELESYTGKRNRG